MLSDARVKNIITNKILVSQLADNELADFCLLANQKYRAGAPIITDTDYNFIYLKELAKRLPEHNLLTNVESDDYVFSANKLVLPQPMLSTDKAYLFSDIKNWFNRITKAANEVDFALDDIIIELTAKLDGFAGFDDGSKLYTRGDGKKGSDISHVFSRGLSVFNDAKRGLGAGEIVVKKSYFIKKLSHKFDYPRNFQASIIKEKELDTLATCAILDKAAVFVPFSILPRWSGTIDALTNNFTIIVDDILNSVDFDVDGVVLCVVNDNIKQQMGSNRKFHKWQIAFKENKDKAQVKVLAVIPQVGRTGKITPVVELEPILLSGATLSRASGYHYGYIKTNNLGKDSVIELTRSGLVIPKINAILKATNAIIPELCPSCGTKLIWQGDFLLCSNNTNCRDKKVLSLLFFFATLGNNDGFGRATIEKIYDYGIGSLSEIYNLDKDKLLAIGFGDKTSENLLIELQKSRINSIEDWRFLAAFGVNRLGLGNCERLLSCYELVDIWTLNTEDIANIEGFAELSSSAITAGIAVIADEFMALSSLAINNICPHTGFNLETTNIKQDTIQHKHFFSNKSVVFSGKMQKPRPQMIKAAKSLGIKVLSTVSSKCDYLVIGQNVGQAKLTNANNAEVAIITEADYLEIITKIAYE